jgi:putative FmdB family regulatory protein
MALYEYQCDACGHRFEIIQKWSDPPQETCPKCGGAVHKLQSAPAFQFKGTGWYVTDYAKKDQGGSKSSGDSTADTKGSSESD